jgi:diaminopimelate epimerase
VQAPADLRPDDINTVVPESQQPDHATGRPALAVGLGHHQRGSFLLRQLGPRVENDPMFPNRTNVEFVEVLEDGAGIKARIWERGVGETQASGTGATASAYMAHKVHGVEQPITVHLRGGELSIVIDDVGAWMEGPGETVFSGSVD